MNVTETVTKLCTQTVEKLGFDLFEVTYKKEADGMNLTLYIESKNGEPITLECCEKVSKAIEVILDAEKLDGQPYLLNVSSLGLDWPIKTERDLQRNKGKMIEVKLYSKQDGQKEFTGVLEAWKEDSVTILTKDKKSEAERVFQRKDIAHMAPHIVF